MSSPRWTAEQEQAIKAGGNNILVAAAAGAGKTATLVERVIRRLADPQDPLDVDRLLVVTFTEAAAAEMRERIGSALQTALAQQPENARLQRQLALLGRASISTLHSFCLGLLRQYFYRLGLDPALTVMGEHEAMLLRHEVLDSLFAKRFDAETPTGAELQGGDGPFFALVERYGGGRDDEGLKQLVLALYDYVQSLPWPEQWLAEAAASFAVAPEAAIESLPWWQTLYTQMRLELIQATTALEAALRLTRLPGGPAAYSDTLQRELETTQVALAAHSKWEELAPAVSAIVFERLPSMKKGSADEHLQEQTKKLRDQARRAVKGLQEVYFSRTAAEWVSDLQWVAPHLLTLVELVQEFDGSFRRAKAEQSTVDFNDLERFALKLLIDSEASTGEFRPSDVARELRERYAEVLVDEYQDINSLQDAILAMVARADIPNRFMVGDVKQSIYRFRHANPSLFLRKYLSYEPWREADLAAEVAQVSAGEGSTGETNGRRIVLGANFRSRSGVVNAVNFLFRQIMTVSVGEVGYDKDAELVCRASYPIREDGVDGEYPVEVHLLDRTTEVEAVQSAADELAEADADSEPAAAVVDVLQELAELTAAEREARLVTRRIKEMVDGTAEQRPMLVYDKELQGYRRLRFRDIVILLRATSGRADLYLEAMNQAGIPAYAQLNTGYFAATEVAVMLSLLQVLDNPRQDIPLVAVLRSPIVGLNSSELARIRLAEPKASFYDALKAASEVEDNTGLAAALKKFLQALEEWRTAVRRTPLSQVVWRIYQETGYLRYVGGMPGGVQRHANLLALYDRARQFDQFARQGLFRFLRFIEQLRESNTDLGAAPALGEGEDVVRVMSIHKSKGLEFPVVFVADMGKSFGRQDQQGDLLLQRHLGFGPQLIDPEQRTKYPTLAWHAVREAIRLEALAEEMRVLYVALTRARERLILVGSVRGLPEAIGRWSMTAASQGWALPDSLLATASTYLDWIGPALARHQDGAVLRPEVTAPGPETAVAADASRWTIHLWDAEAQQSLVQPDQTDAAVTVDWAQVFALQPLAITCRTDTPQELERRFSWQYPFVGGVRRFAKLSVTELKGHFQPEGEDALPGAAIPAVAEEAPAGTVVSGRKPAARMGGRLERRPQFLQETRKSMSSTEFGTLMHLVLQHLDLTQPLDVVNVDVQVAQLTERQLITPQQAEVVDRQAIAAFFGTPVGQLMRSNPDGVRREVSFTLGLPAAEVYTDLEPATTAGEIVVVQGMIDALVESGDGFILVDYKTDKRDPEEAAKAYHGQVQIYRRAVEEILNKPVREVFLHFLVGNQSVRV
ncbi:MAG: helicase-exonuclease AddAB subunit AddA [Mycobacterium leprae]